MSMKPQEYMDDIVLPTVAELKGQPRSRHRAYLACIVTFHLKDHLRAAGERGIEKAMRATTAGAFDVVRGVCNGTKHVQTDGSHPIPFTAGKDWDRPPAKFGEMVLGVSRLGDPHGGREIGAAHGRHDIYSAVTVVLRAFCQSYPHHLGATDLNLL